MRINIHEKGYSVHTTDVFNKKNDMGLFDFTNNTMGKIHGIYIFPGETVYINKGDLLTFSE